jgi:hypothetical protein
VAGAMRKTKTAMSTENPVKNILAYASAAWLQMIAWMKGFELSHLTLEQWIAIVVGTLTAIHLSLRIRVEIKSIFSKKEKKQ